MLFVDNYPPWDAFLQYQRWELVALKGGKDRAFMLQKFLFDFSQKYLGASDLALIFKGIPITAMILPIILTVHNAVQKMHLAEEDSVEYFLMWLEMLVYTANPFAVLFRLRGRAAGLVLLLFQAASPLPGLWLWARQELGSEEVMMGLWNLNIYLLKAIFQN